MPTVESLRRVTVQFRSEGADKARADADAVGAAHTRLASATEAASVTTESASRRSLSAAGSFDRVRASVDGTFRAQQALERQTRILDRALAQGATDAATYANTLGLLQARYNSVASAGVKSARDIQAAWRDLGAQGARQLENVEASRKIASMGMAPPANTNGGHGQISAAYRGQLLQDLAFQGKDFFEQVISGASPLRAALQQGPQALAIAQMGGLGLKDVAGGFQEKLSGIAEGAASVASRLGPVGIAIGTVTAALGTGAAAVAAYDQQQKSLSLSLAGMGRASGTSLGQVNAVALASAGAGGVSVSSARDMAGEFAATGRIGTAMYAGLIEKARDYAATTRQEIPEATKALAEAFADPAAGAEKLNRQLGFLDAVTAETIQRLDAQGNRLGAQRALFDAFAGSLEKADTRLGFFSRQWQEFTRNTGNEFDAIGRAIDRFATGGDLETRIRDLRRVLADGPQQQGGILGFLGYGGQRGAVQGELDRLLVEQQRQQAQSRTADLAARSREVERRVQGANPEGEALKRAEDNAKRIRTELAAGVIDPDGASLRTMQGFEAAARRIREDLAAGGSEMAASFRRAQFDASQVGRSGLGRTTAEIENEMAERQRGIEAKNLEPSKRFEQLQTMELERVTRLQTAQREATFAETARSGLINSVPPNLRQFYLDAAAQTGVPLDFGIAVSKAESSFNTTARPNDPRSHAYGLMQLQPGTAREMGVDPSDPGANVLGGFRYLRQQLDRANGDQALAYGYYHDGPNSSGDSAAARAAYGRIQRTMGAPTTGQEIAGTDTRARALENENRIVGINSEFLGRNGVALDAATRQQQLLNEALAQGRDITPALRKEFAETAGAFARAARDLAGTRAGRDLEFDRDQLGRDKYDQGAFSKARSTFGDTTSPQATAFIDQARQNAYLADARSTVTDAATGFATALSHGTSAASAFSSALSRIGDKLIGGALDSLIGSAFKSGGGGLLGSLGSILGFADGGFTGYGGRTQPAGIVHAGEVVFSQVDVARWGGPHVVDRMRQGYPGYADGGLVDDIDRRAPIPPVPVANTNSDQPQRGGDTWHLDLRGSSLTEGQVHGAIVKALEVNNQEQWRNQFRSRELARRQFG